MLDTILTFNEWYALHDGNLTDDDGDPLTDITCNICHGEGDYKCPCCHDGKDECPNCDGDGYITDAYDHEYKCKHCNGSGEIDCENCNGSGYIDCENCNGSGKITAKTQAEKIYKKQLQIDMRRAKRWKQCN